MAGKWYGKPLFIAALQGGTGSSKYIEVPGMLSSMGFNTEQGPARPGGVKDSLDISSEKSKGFRKYLAETRKSGMRFILYLNTHVLGQPFNYKEWAQQAADGSFPKLYDTRYAVCLNSPWREYFFAALDKYAEFDIDGVFLDGPSMIRGGCFCEHCKARYEKEYGEQLMPEKERFDFYRRTQDDFFNEAYKRFKRIRPEAVFYMNFNLFNPAGSYHSLPEGLEYNDMVGTEAGFQFFSPPQGMNPWRVSFLCKLLEAAAPEKVRVNFMAADQKPWSHYMHTPAETKLCIFSSVANGANIWYGPHGSFDIMDTPGGRAGVEAVSFLRENEKFYEGTVCAGRAGVMNSFATSRYYKTLASITDFYGSGEKPKVPAEGNFTASLYGVFTALARSGIPCGVASDLDFALEGVDSFGCIFLPTCACLSDKTIEKLKDFTGRGGTLVATYDTSLYNEEGKRRKDFGLKEVFGISCLKEVVDYKNWNYVSFDRSHPLFKGIDVPFLPAPEFGINVSVTGKARVLASFYKPMAGRYEPMTRPDKPAVVINRYKKGTGVYLAGTFGEMMNSYAPPEYRKMFANMARMFSGNTVSLDAAENIEVVLRKQKNRMLVHLINYSGLVPRPFEKILPRHNVKIRVEEPPYRKAFALADKEGCSFRHERGMMEITVKELKEYEVIVLE